MRGFGRFEGYSMQSLRRDLLAGLIVGIVAIPLAMSFAIASGVKPQFGIYTTIVAGFLISLLGGSRFQIGGPTGAFVPVLLGVVLQFGYERLLLAGMLAGILLVLMGVFRLGALIQFIPRPVTIGFTSGIAVLIFSGQIANFLGLQHMQSHEYFWDNLVEIGIHLSTFSVYSVLTALIALTAILVTARLFPPIPASLVGLLVSSAAASLLFPGKLATIGSAYGQIPDALPHFALPVITPDLIVQLLPSALVIALLGGIESLLSAVVADRMTGSRHNSNRELISQGIANIVTPLFGGIPATGAIARTATNIKNGAASPVSGMVHGLVVLLVLLLFATYASAIPLASMAPILMVVAWNMSERKEFAHVLRMKTSDSFVLAVTFLLTVLVNLTTAVLAGLALSVVVFVWRMRSSLRIRRGHPHAMPAEGSTELSIRSYVIEGPLFFGAASRLERELEELLSMPPQLVLLHMEQVPLIDATGAASLTRLVAGVKLGGGRVLVVGLPPLPRAALTKSGLVALIGEAYFCETREEAIAAAGGTNPPFGA